MLARWIQAASICPRGCGSNDLWQTAARCEWTFNLAANTVEKERRSEGDSHCGRWCQVLLRADKFFSRRNKDLVGHGRIQDGNIAAWWQDMPVHRDNLGFQRPPLLVFLTTFLPTTRPSPLAFHPFFGTHTTDSSLDSPLFVVDFIQIQRWSSFFCNPRRRINDGFEEWTDRAFVNFVCVQIFSCQSHSIQRWKICQLRVQREGLLSVRGILRASLAFNAFHASRKCWTLRVLALTER